MELSLDLQIVKHTYSALKNYMKEVLYEYKFINYAQITKTALTMNTSAVIHDDSPIFLNRPMLDDIKFKAKFLTSINLLTKNY